MGLSDFSDVVSILVAQVANPPDVPALYRDYDQIIITWYQPYSGNTPIISYWIQFRWNDGVSFSDVGGYCNGLESTVVELR